MLSLSQTSGYAILALSCLDSSPGCWTMAKDIAAQSGVPAPYLSKILHSLGRSGLILTKRGYRGGFALARPAAKITILDIVEAVEGRAWLSRCLLGFEECSDQRACPAHDHWTACRASIEQELRLLTLDQAAAFERCRGRLRAQNLLESADAV